MTSEATTIPLIDTALASRYSGISINTGDPPAPSAVEVFIEEPDPEEYPERVFPSITIKKLSVRPDFARSHSSDEVEEPIGALDTGVSPPEQTMRESPLPYIVSYSIDTWHKARVSESRDLLKEAVLERTKPRGFMYLNNIDSEQISVNVFWSGGVTDLDEVETDEVIYHKSLTVEILAYLIGDETESQAKIVLEHRATVKSRTWVSDSEGHATPIVGEDVTDVTIKITQTGDERID